MIDYPTFLQIKHLHREQLKCSQIADELGLNVQTVAKWLNEDQHRRRKSVQRSRKPVDMFQEELPHLHRPAAKAYDIATISQVRTSRQVS